MHGGLLKMLCSVAARLFVIASMAALCCIGQGSADIRCDVRDYGAVADNKTLSTHHINAAVSNISCGVVVLDGGGVFVSGSIRLRSGVTLSVSGGTTLRGAPNDVGAYDPPEPNPWDMYQDFGHSHWHNALLWGVGVTDVTINGGGVIDGGGIVSDDPPIGGGDKVFSFKLSNNISITDLTVGPSTGHFILLATGVRGLSLERLHLSPTRDCLDVVGSTNVWMRDVHCAGGGDDALVFKSDYATGAALPVRNVTVKDCSFSTDGATAVEIGSETTGEFSDIFFDNITIRSAGDAGIGMAIMDGSVVHNVRYSNIVMTGVDSPFQFYIGARMLRPPPVGQPGSIYDIVVQNVTASSMFNTFKSRNWTATLDGQPPDPSRGVVGTHRVGPNITFDGLILTYKGGGLASDVTSPCPHNSTHWMMVNEIRPSYAFFLRNTVGVTLRNVDIRFERPDGRPCVVLDATDDITLDRFRCMRSTEVGGYDIGLRNGADAVKVIESPGIVTRALAPVPPPPPRPPHRGVVHHLGVDQRSQMSNV